jgi:hypothetical protein
VNHELQLTVALCAAQLIQRRCEVCGGSDLVRRGTVQRRVPQCGGFLPWISRRQVSGADLPPAARTAT